MPEPLAITWAPTAVADARAMLAEAGGESAGEARRVYDELLLAVRSLSRRGVTHDVPPEFMEVGLTHLRETRAGAIRVFFRATPSKIGIVGLIDARRDPGEALFRRMMREVG